MAYERGRRQQRRTTKGYWDERHCYIGESRWDVKYLEKFGSHCLAWQS